MTSKLRAARPVLLTVFLALAAPALGQSAPANVDTRLRAVEAEVKALQRTVFPGGDGKYFPPQVQPSQTTTPAAGTPASTPVSDLLARMDAVEAQMARLTAQGEENANRLSKLEARLAASGAEAATTAGTPAATAPAATGTENGATTNTNLAAMTGGAVAPKPAATAPAATRPAPTPAKPAAAPSSRVAAVKAIQKPATADAGDDEYSYGFRLFDARFYPEAQQQLKMYLQKYPKHARVSYARNLLGRAYLDDNNPREAASWFLQNYQAGRKGDRAPDSLLYLAEAMRQLKDNTRACVALSQFGDDYAAEAAGRLKSQYDAIRATVKCN